MKKYTVDYYNWIEDIGPVLLANINELLVAKGIEPLTQLAGGSFLNGKWVDVLDSNDYRNYWHAYIHIWGERLNNDSYQGVYFPNPDIDEEWQWYIDELRRWASSHYTPSDPNWTDDLIIAMRKLVKENFPLDQEVIFWWCW